MNNYLKRLSKLIKKKIPKEEYDNVMQYYTEYFEDAGVENEAMVQNELGSVETLAKKIISEYSIKNGIEVAEPKRVTLAPWVIVLIAVLGSPIWLAALCVAVALAVVVIVLVVVFIAMGICGAFGGIGVILGGIVMLFREPSLGMLLTGYGFILVACGCGFSMLSALCIQLIVKLIRFIKGKIKEKRTQKVEVIGWESFIQ